jgi:hypothetical protein
MAREDTDHDAALLARGKEPRTADRGGQPPRDLASGSGVKGTTAQPFDGGALTLGSTCAPAKGRMAAPSPSSGHHEWPPSLLLLSAATVRGEGREKKGAEGVTGGISSETTTSPLPATSTATAVAARLLR